MTARIESALSFVPAEDRDIWVQMAMAVKFELGDGGFDIWDAWSRTADNYNAGSAKAVWRSCRGRGVTTGTLFHIAKEYGWVDREKPTTAPPALLASRRREMEARATAEGIEREREQQDAAKKAAWIMHQTKNEQHAYLDSKGWPEAVGAVWWPTEDNNLLCIPMRVDERLVGLQMIDRTGAKRFLKGQRTSEAEYVITNLGRGCAEWYCEGYATGLSLRDCLHALRMRYRIHITFSAQNMVKVAAKHGDGYVVADNDKSGTGERVAKQIGMPYWISGLAGEDFNDFHKRLRLFGASQELRKFLSNSTKKA